jgi:tetratricopeptide (TPR) repeat protein
MWYRSRRHLFLLVSPAAALALLACGAWWWYATSRPDYRLRRGQEALHRGDLEQAQRQASALEASGATDHAHLLRGEALYHQQRYAAALAQFNQIRDTGAIRLQAAALSGLSLLHLKARSEAERALSFVVDQQPDHLEAHRGLAVLYYDQGALSLAMHHLEIVSWLDPQDGRPHRLMGLIFKDLDHKPKAILCYQEALRRVLSSQVVDEVRLELAECLAQQGKFDQALEHLEHCRPLVAQGPQAEGLRAECLQGQGQTAAARALLDKALHAHPRYANLLRLRAKIYLDDSEPAAAVPLLEQAVASDRHDAASRYLLVGAYHGLGREDEAAEQQRLWQQSRKALAELTDLNQKALTRPWDADLLRRLAEVCRQLDKPELAAMWLRAAAACPPLRQDRQTERQRN